MTRKVNWYSFSVAQKLLVGLTGLFLCTFLIVHLSGNLLLLRDDAGRAFEEYSTFMSSNPVIRIMEIVLIVGFLGHIILGVRVWLKNRQARPERYVMNKASQNSSQASRLMFVTGSIVFIFLVVHLWTFWVPARFAETEPHMFELVESAFSSPVYVGFYLVALILLGFHLRHGFQSAFQTFGLRSEKHRTIDLVAIFFWLVIPIGYATMPVYFLWVRMIR